MAATFRKTSLLLKHAPVRNVRFCPPPRAPGSRAAARQPPGVALRWRFGPRASAGVLRGLRALLVGAPPAQRRCVCAPRRRPGRVRPAVRAVQARRCLRVAFLPGSFLASFPSPPRRPRSPPAGLPPDRFFCGGVRPLALRPLRVPGFRPAGRFRPTGAGKRQTGLFQARSAAFLPPRGGQKG